MAKPGDKVPLGHGSVSFDGSSVGRRDDRPFDDGPNWWPGFINARFARELPAPADAAERSRLLERAMNDLFGSAPDADERAAFEVVRDENSLAAFAEKLAQRPGLVPFAESLTPAVALFDIADADAKANSPRVALGPGEYPLGEKVTLKIVGRLDGERHVNDAALNFESGEKHPLMLPDGWGAWAIVCRPNDGFFYVLHQGTARRIDYRNPAKVTDTPANDLPADFRDEVKRVLDIYEIPAAEQEALLKTSSATPYRRPEN